MITCRPKVSPWGGTEGGPTRRSNPFSKGAAPAQAGAWGFQGVNLVLCAQKWRFDLLGNAFVSKPSTRPGSTSPERQSLSGSTARGRGFKEATCHGHKPWLCFSQADHARGFDYFGRRAYHDNRDLPDTILANRSLLKQTMEKYGIIFRKYVPNSTPGSTEKKLPQEI